jgi:hypothetical protein
MDLNRTGLLSMNLQSLKQVSSHVHAQRCLTVSTSVASRLAKELFHLGYRYYCGNAYGGPSEEWVSRLNW